MPPETGEALLRHLTGAEFQGHWRYPVRRFRVVDGRGVDVLVESVYGAKRLRLIRRKRLLTKRYVLCHLGPREDGKIPPFPGAAGSSCLCCPEKASVLDLASNPHPGFGNLVLLRDGEYVHAPDISRDEEVEAYRVQDHEDIAAGDPDHDWRIRIDGPLWNGVYQRHVEGCWVLIERGLGFA